MRELPKVARALLDAARVAHDPSRTEREQADGAVRAALASYGVHVPPLAPPAPPPARMDMGATPRGTASAGSSAVAAAKLGVGVLALCANAWLVLRAFEHEPRPLAPTLEAAAAAAPAQPPPAAPRAAASPSTTASSVASLPSAPVFSDTASPRAVATPRRDRAPRPDIDLDAELRMIAEADALLRAERFEAALRTLALHARRFPQGALREERAALRVLSLCGNGSGPRALRERARFLRAAPRSVLSARVSAACVGPGTLSP